MNHLSEWTTFFDERTGKYWYKHKGSGVIRDTLMAIGIAFKPSAKSAAKKAAQVAAEKAGQKIREKTAEKGAEVIQKILQKKKRNPPSEASNKLNQILENQVATTQQTP